MVSHIEEKKSLRTSLKLSCCLNLFFMHFCYFSLGFSKFPATWPLTLPFQLTSRHQHASVAFKCELYLELWRLILLILWITRGPVTFWWMGASVWGRNWPARVPWDGFLSVFLLDVSIRWFTCTLRIKSLLWFLFSLSGLWDWEHFWKLRANIIESMHNFWLQKSGGG